MKTGRLITQLEEIDPDAELFVNICGHKMRIAYVEAQVGYAELHLYDETIECRPVQ